jgi:aspartyl-tRNA(Asn)/glutamyl-tRNA(Gln) amidotransferase subunit A
MQDPAMTTTDIAYTPAADLARMIRTKQISATEVVRAVLARAEVVQAACNCFITICADQALQAAAAADQALAKGAAVGPLHGVPFHVKDLVNTKGVRTTFASYIHEHNVPLEDSACVRRLKDAGAILIGKTTTPEFGHMPYTEAPLFGRTRNAWAADRTSGGSSGGAAVALAAPMRAALRAFQPPATASSGSSNPPASSPTTWRQKSSPTCPASTRWLAA